MVGLNKKSLSSSLGGLLGPTSTGGSRARPKSGASATTDTTAAAPAENTGKALKGIGGIVQTVGKIFNVIGGFQTLKR